MFRNPTNGLYTRGLFVEQTTLEDRHSAIYSLSQVDKVRDGKTYPSLYKLYMAENDLLEHDFALKYFESWKHWQLIANSTWMKPLIAKWREELELRIRSDALKIIQAEAEAGTKYSYAAAVYLAKQGWKDKVKEEEKTKSKTGAGRPSKAQVQEEITRLALEAHDVDADIKRLGLN